MKLTDIASASLVNHNFEGEYSHFVDYVVCFEFAMKDGKTWCGWHEVSFDEDGVFHICGNNSWEVTNCGDIDELGLEEDYFLTLEGSIENPLDDFYNTLDRQVNKITQY